MRTMTPALRAFESLYDAHFSAVLRALAAYGVPGGCLEDAVQEVFIVAYRRASTFEGRASARAWLCAIARRIASRWHRTSRRRQRRLDAFAAIPPEPPDPERTYACQEAAMRVAAVLARLDDRQREAFVLSDVAGLTRTELADALGVNPNTAWGRVRAARAAIARDLGGAGDVETILDDVAASRPDVQNRVLGLIVVRIGSGLGGSLAATATAGVVATVAAIGIAVIASSVLGSGGAGTERERELERAPIVATTSDAAPAAIAAPPPFAVTLTSAGVAAPPPVVPEPPRAPASRPKRHDPPPAPDAPNDLAHERVALSDARAQLREGDPARTLALLDAYEQRFPNGTLAIEARRLRVLASCRRGDVETARRLAGEGACTSEEGP